MNLAKKLLIYCNNLLLSNRLKLKGGFYVIASGIGGIINLFVNILLGRVLTLEEFAIITLINGILLCTTTISGAFGNAVNYKAGYLTGKFNDASAYNFWKSIRLKSFLFTLFITLIWIIMTPFIAQYFYIERPLPILLCVLIIFFSFGYSADRGFLSSQFKFFNLAILSIFEPLLKLFGAVFLIFIDFSYWTYSLAPLAFFFAFLLGWSFIKTKKIKQLPLSKKYLSFPKSLFATLLFSSTAQVLLLSLDVILAKHYLSPLDAGKYGLVSVITKILFFIGSLMSPLMTPFVSRYEGSKKDTYHILKKIFLGTIFLMLPFFIIFGLLSSITAPLLFGSKALLIYHYLPLTTFAISFFVLGKIISDFYSLKKYYIFPIAFFIIDLLLMLFISFIHVTLSTFIYVISSSWIVSSVVVFILHSIIYFSKTPTNNFLLVNKNINDI